MSKLFSITYRALNNLVLHYFSAPSPQPQVISLIFYKCIRHALYLRASAVAIPSARDVLPPDFPCSNLKFVKKTYLKG
jgi:hypothetical protein